jgi:hypothetical protein
MAAIEWGQRRKLGKFAALVAVATALVLGTSTVSAALASGSLPTVGLTYTSVTENAVNMAGDAIRLKIKDNVTAKTTYSFATPSDPALIFDLPDDCGGSDFVLSRAGTGTTPSAPPPPGS